MQIRTIGKPSIDNVLSQIVERYEAQFPGRLRAYYLTGSYAEGNAVEWSDIDVYVLFKDAFVSEGEAAQAKQLERALAPLTPRRLDLHAESEQSQDSLPGLSPSGSQEDECAPVWRRYQGAHEPAWEGGIDARCD